MPLTLKNWLPEQHMALKTWLQERMWLSNIVTGTERGSQKWVLTQTIVH